MDLRRPAPRSPRDILAGYVHLGRMLDKCRATLRGEHGEYVYPCPMDQRLLNFAGIASEQFTEAATHTPTDEGMAGWFCKAAKPRSEVELEQFNEMMLTRGPDTPENWPPSRKRGTPSMRPALTSPAGPTCWISKKAVRCHDGLSSREKSWRLLSRPIYSSRPPMATFKTDDCGGG